MAWPERPKLPSYRTPTSSLVWVKNGWALRARAALQREAKNGPEQMICQWIEWHRVRWSSHRLHPYFLKVEEMVVDGGIKKEKKILTVYKVHKYNFATLFQSLWLQSGHHRQYMQQSLGCWGPLLCSLGNLYHFEQPLHPIWQEQVGRSPC